MAVDTKQGGTVNGASNGANGKAARRRVSQLMTVASSLPNVEHSLDEFIAKANQTLVDVNWGAAETAAKEEDEQRRQQDMLRMRAAEHQLREGEAREQSLRRQLDGLQGKLAEAEARAAVAGAGASSTSMPSEAALQQLRQQIDAAEAQREAAEAKTSKLTAALDQAKNEIAMARASSTAIPIGEVDGDAAERVRVAEAKAAKAIAAAKAAQAGLTVSSADIAAIESGLVVTSMEPPKPFPWPALAGTFIGGLALMFIIMKLMPGSAPQPASAPAPAAVTQPAAAAPVEPAQPVAAPTPTQPAAVATPPAEPPKPTVTPIEDDPTPEPTTAATPEPVRTEPVRTEPVAKPVKPVKASTNTPSKPPKPPKPGIVDPFGDAPKKSQPKPQKPAKPGGVVDPF
jgi:hypothetical protein